MKINSNDNNNSTIIINKIIKKAIEHAIQICNQ